MDAFAILGVERDATDEEIRSAWIAGVRDHPPDRDPRGFQRLREAYDRVKDPHRRRKEHLFGREDLGSLSKLAAQLGEEKLWMGPGPWLRLVRDLGR
jgi:curved DNA-binding protein CbpA